MKVQKKTTVGPSAIGGEGPKTQATADAKKAEAAQASPPSVADQAKVGAQGYAPTEAGDDVAALAFGVSKTAEVAVAYALAGKPDLARRRLESANEQLETLSQQLGGEGAGLHPGMWSGSQEILQSATEAVTAATAAVAEAKAVVPVSEGKPTKARTVMLFGLSANPPTHMGGHAGIVSWGAENLKADLPNDEKPELARENVAMDEVWVMPVFKHLFSSKSNLVDFDHRFNMAKLAFENLPGIEGRVKVSDVERQVITEALDQAVQKGEGPESVRVGTIDIVERLIADNPDTEFVLALGGDTYRDLKGGKWKRGDDLQAQVPIVVIPRKGVDGVEGSEDNGPELTDISSTKVRGSIDLEFLQGALHPDVLQYIQDHDLYAFEQE